MARVTLALTLILTATPCGRAEAPGQCAGEAEARAPGGDDAALLQIMRRGGLVPEGVGAAASPPWNYRTFQLGDWSSVSAACAGEPVPETNRWQAPINIDAHGHYPPLPEAPPVFHAAEGGCPEANYIRKGNTWQVDFASVKCTHLYVIWKGKPFTLVQLHLHILSEDTVDFVRFAGQVHMVHAAADGELLVAGVLLQADGWLRPAGPGAKHVAELLDRVGGAAPAATDRLNPYRVLVTGEAFWHYLGTLTTPPCAPSGINFMTMQMPKNFPSETLHAFRKYLLSEPYADSYGHNARPAQPLNNRTISQSLVGGVTEDGKPCPWHLVDPRVLKD